MAAKTGKKKSSGMTVLIIIGIVILLIFVVPKFFKKGGKDEKKESLYASSPSSGSSSSGSSSQSSYETTTVLRRGMNSTKADKNVIQWSQYEINRVHQKIGIVKLVEDGIFGSKTEAAFQKLLGKKTGSYREVFNKVKELL